MLKKQENAAMNLAKYNEEMRKKVEEDMMLQIM